MSSKVFGQTLLKAILEASPDGILVVDIESIIVSHNQHFCSLFKFEQKSEGELFQSLIGLNDKIALQQVIPMLKEPKTFIRRVEELYSKPEIEDYDEIALKDGRTLERHSKSLWDNQKQYLGRVWFFRDITERKALECKLEDLSCRDPLTGVSNRRHFHERAAEEVSRAHRKNLYFSVIYLDIDKFKSINDKFGHAFGDKVIINFCRISEKMLRKQDMLGRIGGEEFAIFLPDTMLEGAFELAERLRQTIESQHINDGMTQVNYTFSAGVATFSKEDSSIENVLARADRAMYLAKSMGRNLVIRA